MTSHENREELSQSKATAFPGRHLPGKMIREQNMSSVIRIYLPYLETFLIAVGPGAQYRMQVSNMFTANFRFCPSKANSRRFKSISCDRSET